MPARIPAGQRPEGNFPITAGILEPFDKKSYLKGRDAGLLKIASRFGRDPFRPFCLLSRRKRAAANGIGLSASSSYLRRGAAFSHAVSAVWVRLPRWKEGPRFAPEPPPALLPGRDSARFIQAFR